MLTLWVENLKEKFSLLLGLSSYSVKPFQSCNVGLMKSSLGLLYLCVLVKPQGLELSLCLQMKSWPWANHFIAFCFPFPSCSTRAGDIQACMHPHLYGALSLKGATEKSKCCHFPSRALGTSACSVSKSRARAELWASGFLRSKSHVCTIGTLSLCPAACGWSVSQLIVPLLTEPLNWKYFLKFPDTEMLRG